MNVKQMVSKYYQHIPKWLLMRFATPRNLIVEPIAGCNVTCSACPQDILTRAKGQMSMGTFRQIIDKASPRSVGLYFMGEPFLNRDIFEMIEYAQPAKVTINTNGSTLMKDFIKIMDSSLAKICVSVDGVTQETFEAYRHGIDAKSVLTGLKLLTMIKSHVEEKPHIQVRTLMFENTLKEMKLIDDTIASMGITDHRHIKPIVTGWGGKVNLDIDILGHKGKLKNIRPKICPSLFRAAVTWDGLVIPCCNDVHADNVFGDIRRGSWKEIIWSGDMWLRKAKRQFDICSNCYEE